MKYTFDYFDVELISLDTANVYLHDKYVLSSITNDFVFSYGIDSGQEYKVFLRPKSWFEKLFIKDENIKNLPNIIFRRGYRGMRHGVKIVITAKERDLYKFTLETWILPFRYFSKSPYYVAVSAVDELFEQLAGYIQSS